MRHRFHRRPIDSPSLEMKILLTQPRRMLGKFSPPPGSHPLPSPYNEDKNPTKNSTLFASWNAGMDGKKNLDSKSFSILFHCCCCCCCCCCRCCRCCRGLISACPISFVHFPVDSCNLEGKKVPHSSRLMHSDGFLFQFLFLFLSLAISAASFPTAKLISFLFLFKLSATRPWIAKSQWKQLQHSSPTAWPPSPP